MCVIKTERLYIRKRTENDYEYFKMLYGNCNSSLAKIYKDNPDLLEKSCYNIFIKCKDEMFLSFTKETNEFCGQLELRDTDAGGKELGIDFLVKFQNNGIGTEAIVGFSNWLYETRNYSELTIRTDPENKRIQHIFEKLGAIFIEQKSELSPEIIEILKNSNLDYNTTGPYYYKLPIPIKLLGEEV